MRLLSLWKRTRGIVGLVALFVTVVSTAAALTNQSAAPPLAGWVIVVDPGHGGADRGACHFGDGLIEKQINLDMAFRLEERLHGLGARVHLTRTDDRFVTLDDRAHMANELRAHLLISLHVNRYPSPVCFGAQAFYHPQSEEGKRLALLVQDELLQVDPANYRQALPGNYRVLRLATMPGVLVEIGFITHEGDRRQLADFKYRDRVAEAVATGVVRFAAREGREHKGTELPRKKGETAGENDKT